MGAGTREGGLPRVRRCVGGRRLLGEASGADGGADERMAYAEAHDKVTEIANLFKHEYGCVKGDRIAIASRNLTEWILCFWVRPLPF